MPMLDTLIFGYRQLVNSAGALVTKRSSLKVIGGTLSDDGVNSVLTVGTQLGPDGTGFTQFTAPTHDTSNAHADKKDAEIDMIVTPVNTATPCFTWPLVQQHQYSFRGIVAIANLPVSAFAEWSVLAQVRSSTTGPIIEIVNANPVTLIGPTGTTFVLAAAISGSNFVLNITDPVGGRRVTGSMLVIDRIFQ